MSAHQKIQPSQFRLRLFQSGFSLPALTFTALSLFGGASTLLKAADEASSTLIYQHPAKLKSIDREALPIGNGKLGAMLMSDTADETVQVNVDTLWNGDEQVVGSYQNLGFIKIHFEGVDAQSVKNYQRKLNLNTAVLQSSFESKGVHHTREAFSSAPDKVIVLSFSADKPISGTIALEDDLGWLFKHPPVTGAKKLPSNLKKKIRHKNSKKVKYVTIEGYKSRKSSTVQAKGHTIALDGELANGMKYGARLLARCQSGNISSNGKTLQFKQVKGLEILFVADTDYKMDYHAKWKGAPVPPILKKRLASADSKDFDALKKAHIAEYQSFYNRVSIDFGTSAPAVASLPTDQRLKNFKSKFAELSKSPKGATTSPDIDLEELIANYGRYLLISSSRPGCMPANLQGIWNWSNAPRWQSDYHSNINVQMNYWMAEPNALGDCHTAFTDFIVAMRDVYAVKTPRELKKHPNGKPITRGWSLRTGTNVFGGDTFKWNHPAPAWYAQHLWEHYAFGEDKSFLKNKAYPIFKEIVQFWEDRLDKRPDGTLVVPDGWSPEHGPTEPGVSYDQEIVYDIFTNFIEASTILGLDADYRAKVIDMRKHLLKPKIGSWGQLQEWEKDRDQKTDTHRHVSHLFALHPGRMISPLTTPKLAAAAKVSLTARGDGGTGWSKAWKISFWARMHDGEHAHKILCEQVTKNFFPNLFDFHPPFQIDGNFGNTAGVTEMLIQSHMRAKAEKGELLGPWILHLLPSLPQAWATGSAKGLRARGNLKVDMLWSEGKLTQATITGKAGQRVPIYYQGKQVSQTIPASGKLVFKPR